MIGTSRTEFIFIKACILFLHHIVTLSIAYCALLILNPLLPAGFYRAPFAVEVWLILEAVFFTVVFLPLEHHLQRPATHPPLRSRKDRRELFSRCTATVEDPEKYLSQWFLGANKEQIKRENVQDFLRWAFLDTAEVRDEDEDEMEEYIKGTEKMLGRELPPGRGSAKSLRLTLDKIEFLHRSLLWYFCIYVTDTITYCRLLYSGFYFHRTRLSRFFKLFPIRPFTLLSTHRSPVEHLTYWYRPHLSKDQLPVLFIHGIGIGLYPYFSFLRELNATGEAQVGIIALEIMPISSRLTHPMLEKDVTVSEISDIVKHHGWKKFVLVAHSYGSAISTHLIKSPVVSPLVGPVVLIDPITFLLHIPDVAYNFTVRRPVGANEHQLWYFGSKDVGVAHTLARRFFWSDSIIWKEDLGVKGTPSESGRDVTIVLSGKDLIVDTAAVRRYLQAPSPGGFATEDGASMERVKDGITTVTKINPKTGVLKDQPWRGNGSDILWFEGLDHAQVFDSQSTRKPVIKAVRAYTSTG